MRLHFAKDRQDIKQRRRCCLSRIEHVTERVKNILGHGQGAAVFSASIYGQWNRLQLFKLDSQGGLTEKPNTGGINKDSTKKNSKEQSGKLF